MENNSGVRPAATPAAPSSAASPSQNGSPSQNVSTAQSGSMSQSGSPAQSGSMSQNGSISQSGSMSQASCPDSSGTLPSCAGLAVPYVPFQQNCAQKYSQSEALSNGTLFPGLNLPFHLAVDGSALPATPLAELQALEFVVLELGLYLDTHKDDTEAFALFKQFSAMEKAAKAAYESKFGPITMQGAASGNSFQWLCDPWPWNYGQNEVK